MQKQITNSGIEHGLLEEISNCVPDTGYKNMDEKHRKEMLERRKKDLELVKGKYINVKNQEHGRFEGWDAEYPGVSMKNYRLLHDNIYTISRGFANKINKMKTPLRSDIVDPKGRPMDVQGKFDQTHMFLIGGDL